MCTKLQFIWQCPDDVASADDLVICFHDWDRSLSLELAGNLPMQGPLVGQIFPRSLRLVRQEELAPLLPEQLNHAHWIWSASA